MTFLDLFAGIGGFRRGMELAGHRCVGFCEENKYAVASYTSMHLITERQREHLKTLNKKKRQKEILKDEYRNGEWYADDIRAVHAGDLPDADGWCFGAPCQDFSIAGRRAGLEGDRSSLVGEVFRLLRDLKEEDRPTWLIYENVKGMLSSNQGFDFLEILCEMDGCGYDVEWQLLNSKLHGVPQNRERVYTIGHFRGRGGSKVFPITAADGKDCADISIIGHREGYRRSLRLFGGDGISEALDTAEGGGRGLHTVVHQNQFGIDYSVGGEIRSVSNAISRKYDNGVSNRKQEGTAVAIDLKAFSSKTRGQPYRNGYAATLDHNCNQGVWYPKAQRRIVIRKLTPKECFRLQGWTDDYFARAEFVNSDSQLYKQAGNGVTVSVVKAIAERIF